jgi:hypothetical protein
VCKPDQGAGSCRQNSLPGSKWVIGGEGTFLTIGGGAPESTDYDQLAAGKASDGNSWSRRIWRHAISSAALRMVLVRPVRPGVLELRKVHLVSDLLEPLKWRREHFVVTSDGISGAGSIDSLAELLDVSWFAREGKPLIRTRQEF